MHPLAPSNAQLHFSMIKTHKVFCVLSCKLYRYQQQTNKTHQTTTTQLAEGVQSQFYIYEYDDCVTLKLSNDHWSWYESSMEAYHHDKFYSVKKSNCVTVILMLNLLQALGCVISLTCIIEVGMRGETNLVFYTQPTKWDEKEIKFYFLLPVNSENLVTTSPMQKNTCSVKTDSGDLKAT